ncbi:uncharacterized protein A4U43_C07F11380 [Asparagus officinalis]|uniref:Uncharacterized protein n=1 Tax=Asparagus officinalis TaxID=4686 RepID=A0A5P1EB27_ASPOF|nr:uncharacterized protein A4U43_C07F11380 [Asparagus officinalis]
MVERRVDWRSEGGGGRSKGDRRRGYGEGSTAWERHSGGLRGVEQLERRICKEVVAEDSGGAWLEDDGASWGCFKVGVGSGAWWRSELRRWRARGGSGLFGGGTQASQR